MVDSMAESIEIGWINQIANMQSKFGELSMIRQTKTTKIGILTINNLLAYVLIRQTFSPNARKESICQTFPPHIR